MILLEIKNQTPTTLLEHAYKSMKKCSSDENSLISFDNKLIQTLNKGVPFKIINNYNSVITLQSSNEGVKCSVYCFFNNGSYLSSFWVNFFISCYQDSWSKKIKKHILDNNIKFENFFPESLLSIKYFSLTAYSLAPPDIVERYNNYCLSFSFICPDDRFDETSIVDICSQLGNIMNWSIPIHIKYGSSTSEAIQTSRNSTIKTSYELKYFFDLMWDAIYTIIEDEVIQKIEDKKLNDLFYNRRIKYEDFNLRVPVKNLGQELQSLHKKNILKKRKKECYLKNTLSKRQMEIWGKVPTSMRKQKFLIKETNLLTHTTTPSNQSIQYDLLEME